MVVKEGNSTFEIKSLRMHTCIEIFYLLILLSPETIYFNRYYISIASTLKSLQNPVFYLLFFNSWFDFHFLISSFFFFLLGTEHSWLQNAKKASNVPLGDIVRTRLKQFSVMNRFKKKALRVCVFKWIM